MEGVAAVELNISCPNVSHGLDYARERMYGLAQEAAAEFAALPPTPARDALIDLARYTIQRKR